MERGILAPPGVKCCKRHLEEGLFKDTNHVLDKRIQKESFVKPSDIDNLLEELRSALRKCRSGLDFDDPDSLSDRDYYNLTGKLRESTCMYHSNKLFMICVVKTALKAHGALFILF